MGGVVGVVLAAGASTRLGRPKQLLRFGDATLLEHVVTSIERAALDRVVVVIDDAVSRAGFGDRSGRAEVVLNPDPLGGGSASSMQIGLAAAGDCQAIVLTLGDMPGVTADVVDAVVVAWRDRPTWAAVSRYADGTIAHPFLFSAAAFARLRTLHGDKAIWAMLHDEPPGAVAEIAHVRPAPDDVDTWDDYRTVCDVAGVTPERRR